MLNAGVARSTITPPVGMTMAGYAAREGAAEDKDGELFAQALVLDDEVNRIAILSFDLLFIQEPLVTVLRRDIGHCLDIPPHHVLLNFSHTHCGPTFEGLQYDDDSHQHQLRQAYNSRLRTEIPPLAILAAHRSVPARIGFGLGEACIGINRRELQSDGSVILGENPCGPVDHSVAVIRVDDSQGRPMATVFSHGCHPVALGPKHLRWSADYVGPARTLVEQNTGGIALFLQANAGDINPISGIGSNEDNSNEKTRLGLTLGGEVLKVVSSIYTESTRGPRTLVGSLSKIPFYPRIPIQREPDHAVEAREEMLELRLEDFPDAPTASDIYDKWNSEVANFEKHGTKGAPVNVARHFRHWAAVLRDAVTEKRKPAVRIPVQVLRIGDLAIVGVPGETFTTSGLQVKSHSPLPHTLFLGYSNGCMSYIPTAEAYPPNGWSVTERYYVPDMLFQAYLLPTALAPDSSERVVNKALELLRSLRC